MAGLVDVAPFTGAWIEIKKKIAFRNPAPTSHPSRVRGLKYGVAPNRRLYVTVAPFTGAWIEIRNSII